MRDEFLSGGETPVRISKRAQAALRDGPLELARIFVTKRRGEDVAPEYVDVVTLDEVVEFEDRLKSDDSVTAYRIERSVAEVDEGGESG